MFGYKYTKPVTDAHIPTNLVVGCGADFTGKNIGVYLQVRLKENEDTPFPIDFSMFFTCKKPVYVLIFDPNEKLWNLRHYSDITSYSTVFIKQVDGLDELLQNKTHETINKEAISRVLDLYQFGDGSHERIHPDAEFYSIDVRSECKPRLVYDFNKLCYGHHEELHQHFNFILIERIPPVNLFFSIDCHDTDFKTYSVIVKEDGFRSLDYLLKKDGVCAICTRANIITADILKAKGFVTVFQNDLLLAGKAISSEALRENISKLNQHAQKVIELYGTPYVSGAEDTISEIVKHFGSYIPPIKYDAGTLRPYDATTMLRC